MEKKVDNIIKNIKKIDNQVNQAVELQRKGQWDKALEILEEAKDNIKKLKKLLPESERKRLLGLIWHYQGRILQAMGEYRKAINRLKKAIRIRQGDPIGRAYSIFQLFICKIYGGIPISSKEVNATKKVLLECLDKTRDPREMGDIFQNLAYIEQKKGDIKKAIWLYEIAGKFREIANDKRGHALTYARLGECYKQIGKKEEAQNYGEEALGYFKEIGDLERIHQIKKNIFGEEV